MDGGALHRCGRGRDLLVVVLLVASASTVLVLFPGPEVAGASEHLDDHGVARSGLQAEQAVLRGGAGRMRACGPGYGCCPPRCGIRPSRDRAREPFRWREIVNFPVYVAGIRRHKVRAGSMR